MTTNELDILAVLLDDASEEVRERVAALVRTDAEFAKTVRNLEALTVSARDVAASLRESEQRAIQGAARVIATQSRDGVTGRRTAVASSSFWRTGIGLAAAAAVLVVAGVMVPYMTSFGPGAEVSSEIASAGYGEYRISIGSSVPGQEATPTTYARISDGIAAAKPGDTVRIYTAKSAETLFLNKPLRLVAVGGTVSIGKLD